MPLEQCLDHSEHSRAIRKHDERLDKHGEEIDATRELLARITAIEEQNQKRLDDIDVRLDALEAIPRKRYETVLASAISLLLGAAIGGFTSYLS